MLLRPKGIRFYERDGDKGVFAHHSGIGGGRIQDPAEGDRVTFDVEQGTKGSVANNVVKL